MLSEMKEAYLRAGITYTYLFTICGCILRKGLGVITITTSTINVQVYNEILSTCVISVDT